MTRRYFKRAAAPPAPIDLNPRPEPALDFPWHEFGTMTPADYDEIGFICGLEVHQQLITRRKLFCHCPAGISTDQIDAELLRHMRPTLSELGQYDGCALMEFKTNKEIVYRLARSCVCTYEMDDTPPFPIDEEAVRISLAVAASFGMSLVSELKIMRKQYLDGSIPTGFQRTGMIAGAGEIPFRESELGPGRVLRLRQLTLEEDSCREVRDVGHRIVFRTDRLGTPLIETVTEPDLLTPHDAAAGGRLLAGVARASGKVRRGIGAARQDVNVSIAGSRRVELKGVPRLRVVPRLVHVEAFRHLELLRIRHELAERGVTATMLTLTDEATPWNSPIVALADDAVRPTRWEPLISAREHGYTAAAVRLSGFGGLLTWRTQPGTTFAQEFSERLRVIACLTTRPFMTHDRARDELEPAVWERVRALLSADSEDALIVVWGSEEDIATACREIPLRAQDALIGVPSETRQAHGDGTTGLERILPGPERMYPDTDTPPVRIEDHWVDAAALMSPEMPWEREDRYVAAGLDPVRARRLAAADWAPAFDAAAPAQPDVALRLFHALEMRVPHLRRQGALDGPLDGARLGQICRALEIGAVRPEAFDALLDYVACAPEVTVADVLDEYVPGDDDADLLTERLAVVATFERRNGQDDDALVRRGMGEVMPFLLGRLDPAVARARVRETLGLTVGGERRMTGDPEDFKGYRDPTLGVMKRSGVTVWSEVVAETTRGRFEGLVLPRSETSDADHLVLKLVSGYNVGLRASTITKLTKTGYKKAVYKIPDQEFPKDPGKPRVMLLGTGGTIASRLDYRTGAVIPAFTPGELYGSVPELADVCNLETEKLFGVFSENMGGEQYLVLAERIGEAIRAGYDGVMVGHGTDTMAHTAAALSFMVQRPPVPVVMVGSQRSSDRPSSDAARNLISAAYAAAHGPIAEVMVCMLGASSHRYNLLHRGTRVRKMHASYRSTFRTLGDVPLAMVQDEQLTPIHDEWNPRRSDREVTIQAAFSDRVTILYYYPNMQADLIDAMVEKGYEGIVIAGTGLGHVNRTVYPALERAHAAGVHVYMTLQTLWGFVQMNVYETGREILELGVVPLANMIPEAAFMKLSWAIGLHPGDPAKVRELMTTPIAGETTLREPHDGYLLFQGGVPEIRRLRGQYWS